MDVSGSRVLTVPFFYETRISDSVDGNEIELKSKKDDLSTEMVSYSDLREILSYLVEEYDERIANIELEQDSDSKEIAVLKEILIEQQNEINCLKERNIVLGKECKSQKEIIEKINRACESLKISSNETEGKNTILRARVEELLKAYKDAQQDVKKLKQENVKLLISSLKLRKAYRDSQNQLKAASKNMLTVLKYNHELNRRMLDHQFEVGLKDQIKKWLAESEKGTMNEHRVVLGKMMNLAGLAAAYSTFGLSAIGASAMSYLLNNAEEYVVGEIASHLTAMYPLYMNKHPETTNIEEVWKNFAYDFDLHQIKNHHFFVDDKDGRRYEIIEHPDTKELRGVWVDCDKPMPTLEELKDKHGTIWRWSEG